MLKALLLNPPFPKTVFRDHYCASESKGAVYLWHPLDLLIQGACLKNAGYELLAIDAIALKLSLAEVLRRISQFGVPDVAVVQVSRRSWVEDVKIIRLLKDMGAKKIVGTGDFLRFGEYPIDEAVGLIDWSLTDFTSEHLPESLRENTPVGGGIATLEDVKNGEFRDMGRRLVSYPCPDPHLFAPAHYRLPYPGFTPIASMLTTYGCPHSCKYCHVGELGARLRDPEDILFEVKHLMDEGFGYIYIRDATINSNRTHLTTWVKAMARRKLQTPWSAFATAKPFDSALARDLKNSGCQHLQIGLETVSDTLRDHNNKPFDGDAHRAFIDICNSEGIEVTAHLVLGLPGEEQDEFRDVLRKIADLPVSYLAVNLAEQRPGLPWKKEGIVLPVDPMKTGDDSRGKSPTAELEKQRDAIYRRFYLRPGRLKKELMARGKTRDFEDVKGLFKSTSEWVKGAIPFV